MHTVSLGSAVWQQVWARKSNFRDFEQRISGDDGISYPRDLFVLSTDLFGFWMLFLSVGNRCNYLQLMHVCKGHQGLVCKHPCVMDVLDNQTVCARTRAITAKNLCLDRCICKVQISWTVKAFKDHLWSSFGIETRYISAESVKNWK